MRDNGFQATTLQITVRDNDLFSFQRQIKLPRPTNLTAELVPAAMELFKKHYNWFRPIRSLGIRGSGLVADDAVYQLNMFIDEKKREKTERLERCVDRIREHYGYYSLQRAVHLCERLKGKNANNDIGDAQIFYTYR
jgi:DNA polymerase-4